MKKTVGKRAKRSIKLSTYQRIRNSGFPFVQGFIVLGYVLFATILLLQWAHIDQQRVERQNYAKALTENYVGNHQVHQLNASLDLKVPILMYHYVEYVTDKRDSMREALNIKPYAFEDQIRTLKENGYTFMTARELGDVLNGVRKLPPKPILITIDDGHKDMETTILPILEKYHAKATAYIIPGFTGGDDFMTEDQVRTVLKSGLVEIGAHSIHHIPLKNQSQKTLVEEIEGSKKMLEDTYHISVKSFAYPSGIFDENAIRQVRAAGYTTGVSTMLGNEVYQKNRYVLYRIRPGYREGQELISYINLPVLPVHQLTMAH